MLDVAGDVAVNIHRAAHRKAIGQAAACEYIHVGLLEDVVGSLESSVAVIVAGGGQEDEEVANRQFAEGKGFEALIRHCCPIGFAARCGGGGA